MTAVRTRRTITNRWGGGGGCGGEYSISTSIKSTVLQSSVSAKTDEYLTSIADLLVKKLFPFSNLLMQTKKITFNLGLMYY